MQKEIKFRAYDKQIKEMLNVDRIDFHKDLVYIRSVTRWHSDTPRLISDEICTLLLYSGIKDKNGKEIYDGDIFKIGAEKEVFEVRFEHGCFLAYCNGKQYGLVGELQICFIDVIGNIFENAELLQTVA